MLLIRGKFGATLNTLRLIGVLPRKLLVKPWFAFTRQFSFGRLLVEWARFLEFRWKKRMQGKVDFRDGVIENDKDIRLAAAQNELSNLVRLVESVTLELNADENTNPILIEPDTKNWWYQAIQGIKPLPMAEFYTKPDVDSSDELLSSYKKALAGQPPAKRSKPPVIPDWNDDRYNTWREQLRERDVKLYAALGFGDRPDSREWFSVLGSGGWTDGPDGPDGTGK
jgi:hypothetical protein